MTLDSVCNLLHISESSLKSNFRRTKESLLKKDIEIVKEGRGSNAEYFLYELIPGAVRDYANRGAANEIHKKYNNEQLTSEETWPLSTIATAFNTSIYEARNKLIKEMLKNQ